MTELTAGYLDQLLTDKALAEMIGEKAELEAMLRFELALAISCSAHGLISRDASEGIQQASERFLADGTSLAEATLKDGVVVPEFVRQFRARVDPLYRDAVHFGATSQDVIDTALALKLRPVLAAFEDRIKAIVYFLDTLSGEYGNRNLMGRTRMQAAISITVADRIAVWRGLLTRAAGELDHLRETILIISLAGPAGTSEKFGDRIEAVRETLGSVLGLGVPDYVPHAARDRIAALGDWLSRVTGALGKIGQDIALMAQNEFGEISLSGSGGSSAMAHKQNPVRAEVLVALARFNATQLSGLHQSLVHEQERSGAAWTLEWMILPLMLNATGTSLIHAQALLSQVKGIGRAD